MDNVNLRKFSELEIMIGNMYGEARLVEGDKSDDIREYLAIGNVVLNRTKSSRWPNTPKDVMLQRNQFSWTNEGDPSRLKVIGFLNQKSPAPLYRRLRIYAEAILSGRTVDFSNGANHYVAMWLYERESKQSWISRMMITAAYGGHIFLKQ